MPTMEDIWRSVRLQAPDVPPMLARKFVQDTYNLLADQRGWTWLTLETALQTVVPRTITTAIVSRGSTTVTSTAEFLSTDTDRQFRVGLGETFTLTYVNASSATLDRAFTGVSGTVSAVINSAYAILPTTIGRFLCLIDPIAQRRLTWTRTQDELNRMDPLRTSAGQPVLIASLPYQLQGRSVYEWWPRPSQAATYPALVVTRPAPLADTDSFTGTLATRPDVLEMGALARAASWPGTSDHQNAYFNLQLSQLLMRQFADVAQQLDLRDDDVAQQSWDVEQWERRSAWEFAYDTHLIRSTDMSAGGDYYGWGSY
jgi:hypothetical protein